MFEFATIEEHLKGNVSDKATTPLGVQVMLNNDKKEMYKILKELFNTIVVHEQKRMEDFNNFLRENYNV